MSIHIATSLCVLVSFILMVYCKYNGSKILYELTRKEEKISNRFYIIQRYRWPKGIVYYDMDPSMTENRELLQLIRETMEYLSSSTDCVKFVQRFPWDDSVKNYVSFVYYTDSVEEKYCAANVGLQNRGKGTVNLGQYCMGWFFSISTGRARRTPILHELMHTLGLTHTFGRPDRDCYIWITDSVRKYDENWKRVPASNRRFQTDFPFDYESITNYKVDYDTAHPHTSRKQLGRHDGLLSSLDVWKLNHMYCGAASYCKVNALECANQRQANMNNPNCTKYDNEEDPQASPLMGTTLVGEDWYYLVANSNDTTEFK